MKKKNGIQISGVVVSIIGKVKINTFGYTNKTKKQNYLKITFGKILSLHGFHHRMHFKSHSANNFIIIVIIVDKIIATAT